MAQSSEGSYLWQPPTHVNQLFNAEENRLVTRNPHGANGKIIREELTAGGDEGCMPTIIDFRGLTKRFKTMTAVGNVTLQIREGEILGLLGPNGLRKD